MQQVEHILDTASVEFALRRAKDWCDENLCKHLIGFDGHFDYDKIEIGVDLEMIPDVGVNDECKNVIFFNPNKIAWYVERENKMEEIDMPRSVTFDGATIDFRGGSPYDMESAFVHEIVEMVLRDCPGLLAIQMLVHGLAQQFVGIAHFMSWKIENINRIERGLRPWTLHG